ncbi:MAG TPA: trypsin-like peptidase domain-containing protein [Chryseolinea sp.]|nr:trypsin-like peptidase domain-containing protein [Chryseolinea sp.]
MADLIRTISDIRDAVCAVMRIRKVRDEKIKKNKVRPAQFNLAFVGTAFGVVENRYLITAYHIFNDDQPRIPGDKFFVFTVPNNGPQAFHFPVVGFPIEEPKLDIAVLEIGACATPGQIVRAIPFSARPITDGVRVLTYGFPAPVIAGGNIDPNGNFLGGGNFFLKGHANEGIVAGQFDVDGIPIYEFNVGWYNGESGGPVLTLDPMAAIAIMKGYRGIQAKHGVVPGPHAGRPLSIIVDRLRELGAQNL